ncbi:hypothetical protein HRbin21_00286 [bacterium HR21]|nr:hypothetical protein HRbin21_00286 [bacterium HR21]
MPFLPIESVQIPNLGPTAADALAPELQQRQSACTSCPAETPHQPPPPETSEEPSPIVELEFKGRRRALAANPKKLRIRTGDLVLATSPTGTDAGHVRAIGSAALRAQQLFYSGAPPSLALLRLATPEDYQRYTQNRQEEPTVLREARQLARTLPELAHMKLTDAEWQWDRRRLTLYFTAPTRVDFRQYVRLLRQRFRTHIELRQIQPREETRRLGGLGPCGRELCCATFLRDCKPVPLAAARTQLLPLNLTRLSGLCGRLKCCLLYELDLYREALQHYPPLNAVVHTEHGPARIVKLDVLREEIQLQLEETGALLTLSRSQLDELRRHGRVVLPDTPAAGELPGGEDESLPPEEDLA